MSNTDLPPLPYGDTFFIDPIALRQWDDPDYIGTRIPDDKNQFIKTLHEVWKFTGQTLILDSFAPFIRHAQLPNFSDNIKLGLLDITPDNSHLLKSGYVCSRPEEAPVLMRWFDEADVQPVPKAGSLELVVYSRDELVKLHTAFPSNPPFDPNTYLPNVPWGIVTINSQGTLIKSFVYQTPTDMWRNALGVAYGGNGVYLDNPEYLRAVDFWSTRAAVKYPV